MDKGTRIIAIRDVDKRANGTKVVHYFGEGTYQGDEYVSELNFHSPKLVMDDGEVIWGFEAWWGSVEEMENSWPKDKYEWIQVPSTWAQVQAAAALHTDRKRTPRKKVSDANVSQDYLG